MMMSEHFVGQYRPDMGDPESKSGKTLLSIRTDLYNGEVTPIDRHCGGG
jgi:hypothetical protein